MLSSNTLPVKPGPLNQGALAQSQRRHTTGKHPQLFVSLNQQFRQLLHRVWHFLGYVHVYKLCRPGTNLAATGMSANDVWN